MSSFQRQLSRPPPRKSRMGSSKLSVPSLAPAYAMSPAPRSQQVDTSAAVPSSRHDKRKRTVEFDPTNPLVVNPVSVMAATRGVAREALAEQVGLLRRIEIEASQPDVLEEYTPDPELAKVVKRIPEYLQPMVTLMATLVPPTEESRLREKRGREALNQAASMVLTVSTFFCLCLL